jgi:hypothetical protein
MRSLESDSAVPIPALGGWRVAYLSGVNYFFGVPGAVDWLCDYSTEADISFQPHLRSEGITPLKRASNSTYTNGVS